MIENELKYVLIYSNALEQALEEKATSIKHIRQGYETQGARFRSQVTDGVPSYTFSYKVKLKDVVEEFEMSITEQEFTRCYTTCNKKLHKTRYSFYDKFKNLWDVDIFLNGSEVYFAMAECEMPEEEKHSPEELPEVIATALLFAVPRGNTDFTSKKLSDVEYASKRLKELSKAHKS